MRYILVSLVLLMGGCAMDTCVTVKYTPRDDISVEIVSKPLLTRAR
jgi:hypothetical protein